MQDIPAFPVFPETGAGHASAFQGMTLRDYFASAFLANKWCVCADAENTAKKAYVVADAMMKAREA
jgi:hypothetical protein